MTGNEGILADAPVVGDQMKIAVADAAVGDGDFDFLQAQLAWVIAKRQAVRLPLRELQVLEFEP